MKSPAIQLPAAILALSALASLTASASDAGLTMKVTDSGYLEGPGVSVMLESDSYSPVFFDQKDSAMQIILHGHRIATDGSVRLLPTPEQWDVVPRLLGRKADQEHDRLTARISYPSYHLTYQVVAAAEPGGVRVSVNLDEPLPQTLVGRAGFNLELLPSIYMDKAYAVDDKKFGVFPAPPRIRSAPLRPSPVTRGRSGTSSSGTKPRVIRSRFPSLPERASPWPWEIRWIASA